MYIVLTLIFLLIGIVCVFLPKEILVNHYNTLPQKDRSKVDAKSFKIFIVALMFFWALCFAAPMVIFLVSGAICRFVPWLVLGVGTVAAVIYANHKDTFIREGNDSPTIDPE